MPATAGLGVLAAIHPGGRTCARRCRGVVAVPQRYFHADTLRGWDADGRAVEWRLRISCKRSRRGDLAVRESPRGVALLAVSG